MIIKNEVDGYIGYLDLKEITKDSYRNILYIFCDYLDANGITAPSRNDLLAFKSEMLKKLGSASVQKYIVVLRGFFRYLKLRNIYEDISYQVRGCKVETKFKRTPLSLEDSRNLLKKAKRKAVDQIGKRDYALLVLFLTTGLRSIEAARADVEDIDLIANEPVLYIQGKGRDSKAEYVKLPVETYEAINEYLLTVDESQVTKENNKTPLFLTKLRDGVQGRLSTKSIRYVIKEMMIGIGYNSRAYSVHTIRHTFATLSLTQGATLLQTKEALRHKNISTTQIYSHMVEEMKSNTNKLVSDALFRTKKKDK